MFRFLSVFLFIQVFSGFAQSIEIDSSDYNVLCFHPEKGYLEAFGNLKGVLPHGKWLLFNEEGNLYAKGRFKNGKRHGEWIYFDGEGTVMEKGKYIQGMKQGKWQIYEDMYVLFEDGLVVEQNVFK